MVAKESQRINKENNNNKENIQMGNNLDLLFDATREMLLMMEYIPMHWDYRQTNKTIWIEKYDIKVTNK